MDTLCKFIDMLSSIFQEGKSKAMEMFVRRKTKNDDCVASLLCSKLIGWIGSRYEAIKSFKEPHDMSDSYRKREFGRVNANIPFKWKTEDKDLQFLLNCYDIIEEILGHYVRRHQLLAYKEPFELVQILLTRRNSNLVLCGIRMVGRILQFDPSLYNKRLVLYDKGNKKSKCSHCFIHKIFFSVFVSKVLFKGLFWLIQPFLEELHNKGSQQSVQDDSSVEQLILDVVENCAIIKLNTLPRLLNKSLHHCKHMDQEIIDNLILLIKATIHKPFRLNLILVIKQLETYGSPTTAIQLMEKNGVELLNITTSRRKQKKKFAFCKLILVF